MLVFTTLRGVGLMGMGIMFTPVTDIQVTAETTVTKAMVITGGISMGEATTTTMVINQPAFRVTR